ncbi:unnamed protein product [Rotaria socialis]|uniref:ATR-interacting protein n=1 Tax=Rotaria socialis TaxID=392032 RepID=A0A821EKX4_9BILA|nr:unnamed protein product [Rotaria socialis]CAF4637814.1 unnamed protein product [Rotaria socialis]
MYPPIKRLRTNENQDESNHAAGGVAAAAPGSSMMDDFEMTDDELLFSATQVEQQTNNDYYQAQPASQNPIRSHLHVPSLATQTVLQPIASVGNRNENVNKELELERKLLMKEGQIIILEKNNRLLSEKNARLTREKCLLKTEQDEAASAREQRIKGQLDTCKSQLTFNERERSELQTRYHTLETRFHESQETSNRLLREVTRLRTDKPQINYQQQPQQQQQLTSATSNHYRLLQTQLVQFSAYELLRTRTIDSSTMAISSLQIILDRIRPQSITQHIWQTLVDLIFFHQQNSTLMKLKQQDLTIGIDLITMTAFYQMIYNTLHLFNNQKTRLTTNNNDQQQQQQVLTYEQLILILDACSHFLLNTVKSTESLNKQENASTMKKQQEIEPMDDGSSQRSMTDSSQIPFPPPVDHHTAYYTAKGQCLTILKYYLSHSTTNKYPFALFNRILTLYTFHFKTRPTHESERRKAFCAFLISLLDEQQCINPYQYLTAIILSVLDASPDEPDWLCAVPITDEISSQRCLCSVLITHLDSLIYLDKNNDLDEYIKFLLAIYRLQLFIYDNEKFHKMELDNGQCPGLCWLTLFISFGQCLSRFLFHIIKPTIKKQIFDLSIKFVKILILFSLQLQPTTCLPQQAKELQLYTNPSLWHLYEVMLLYHHQQQSQQHNIESISIINKQVLDDQLCVFGYIHDVLGTGNEIR